MKQELFGSELRNIKGQVLTSGSTSRQPGRKHALETTSLSDSKSTEASAMDELGGVDSVSAPSTSRVTEVIEIKIKLFSRKKTRHLFCECCCIFQLFNTNSSHSLAGFGLSPTSFCCIFHFGGIDYTLGLLQRTTFSADGAVTQPRPKLWVSIA